MNKSELKKLIKPIVKECIQEVFLEDGVLSNVVSEVVKGMRHDVIAESPRQTARTNNSERQNMQSKLKESNDRLAAHRRQLMESIGKDAYNGVNLFENTTPMSSRAELPPGSVDIGDPGDSGVDISSLVGNASKIWRQMK